MTVLNRTNVSLGFVVAAGLFGAGCAPTIPHFAPTTGTTPSGEELPTSYMVDDKARWGSGTGCNAAGIVQTSDGKKMIQCGSIDHYTTETRGGADVGLGVVQTIENGTLTYFEGKSVLGGGTGTSPAGSTIYQTNQQIFKGPIIDSTVKPTSTNLASPGF